VPSFSPLADRPVDPPDGPEDPLDVPEEVPGFGGGEGVAGADGAAGGEGVAEADGVADGAGPLVDIVLVPAMMGDVVG
jgi:hypothetical protein